MPASAVTVTPTWSQTAYTVTKDTVTGGTLSGVSSANYNGSVSITAAPATGYTLTGATVKQTSTSAAVTSTVSGNTISFTMPAAAVTVTPVWTKTAYTVSNATVTGGTLSSTTTKNYGDSVSITATPSTGYELTGVTVSNGATNVVRNGNTITFTMPASNVTVTPVFSKTSFIVTKEVVTGGTLNGVTSSTMDTLVTITAAPSTGYAFGSVIIKDASGSNITPTVSGNTITFTMPASAVTLTPTWVQTSYAVNKDVYTGGTLNGVSSAFYNTSIEITSTAATGYTLSNAVVTDGNGTVVSSTLVDGKVTFTMPASAVSVKPTWTLIDYAIEAGTAANGSVTARTGTYKEVITMTATPAEGYELSGVSVTNAYGGVVESTFEGNEITFEMPAEKVIVTPTFKLITYTVTGGVYTNGTLTLPTGEIDPGTSVTIFVTADNGYEFTGADVDGVSEVNVDVEKETITFTMPAKNVVITPVFEALSYSIYAGSFENGTISTIPQSGKTDSTIEVVVIPEEGYTLVDATIEGASDISVSGNVISFTMPAKDVLVIPVLSADAYTITGAELTNGSFVTELPKVSYTGEKVTLEVKPDSGYYLSSISLPGAKGFEINGNFISFTMPATDLVFKAFFAKESVSEDPNKMYTITAVPYKTLTTYADPSSATAGTLIDLSYDGYVPAGYEVVGYTVIYPSDNSTELLGLETAFKMPAEDCWVRVELEELSVEPEVEYDEETGDKTTTYPDGTVHVEHADGSTTTYYPDGTIVHVDKDGNITTTVVDEDGTITSTTVYTDGSTSVTTTTKTEDGYVVTTVNRDPDGVITSTTVKVYDDEWNLITRTETTYEYEYDEEGNILSTTVTTTVYDGDGNILEHTVVVTKPGGGTITTETIPLPGGGTITTETEEYTDEDGKDVTVEKETITDEDDNVLKETTTTTTTPNEHGGTTTERVEVEYEYDESGELVGTTTTTTTTETNGNGDVVVETETVVTTPNEYGGTTTTTTTTENEYDESGELVGTTTTTTTTVTDENGDLVEETTTVVRPDGTSTTTTTTVDEDGVKTEVTVERDENGDIVSTTTTVTQPNGSSVTTTETTDADGNKVETTVKVDRDGNIIETSTSTTDKETGVTTTVTTTTNADGSTTESTVVTDKDGNLIESETITRYPDGSSVETTVTVDKDGVKTEIVIERDENGDIVKVTTTTTYPDGSSTTVTETTDSDGNKVDETVERDKDGNITSVTTVVTDKDTGETSTTTTVIDPDGTITTTYPNGTTIVTKPDGTTVTTYPDGTIVTVNPDGTTTIVPGNPDSVKVYYTVTKVENNGQFTVNTDEAQEDALIRISDVVAGTDYVATGVLVDGELFDLVNGEYTFAMPDKHIEVEVVFELIANVPFTITTMTLYGLTVTTDPEGEAVPTTPVLLSTTGEIIGSRRLSGYMISYNGTIDVVSLGESFTMPSADIVVMPVFTDILDSYQITVDENSQENSGSNNGYLKVITSSTNLYGEYAYSVHPDPGYKLEKIIESYVEPTAYGISMINDGQSEIDNPALDVEGTMYYAYLMQPKNLVLSAVFSKVEYTATVASIESGTVTLGQYSELNYGDAVNLTITPDAGYQLDELYYQFSNGTKVTIDGDSFAMPNDNVTVYATFTALEHNIIISSNIVGGTISTDFDTQETGEVVTINNTPSEGYRFEAYNVMTTEGLTIVVNGDGEFTMPDSNVIVSATFVKNGYNITVSAKTEGGSPSVDKAVASSGDFVTIYPNAYPGYALSNVTVIIGEEEFNYDKELIITVQSSDAEILVSYEKIVYNISINITNSVGGEVLVNKTAVYGDEVEVTITPVVGYSVSELTVTGVNGTYNVGSNDSFTMPTEDVAVNVTFTKDTYTVYPAQNLSNVGLTFTPSSGVEFNQEVTVSVEVADGYELDSLFYVEAGVTTNIDDFTFNMPANDVVVYATVIEKTYTATVLLNIDGYGLVGIRNEGMSATLNAGTLVELYVMQESLKEGTLTGAIINDGVDSYEVDTYFVMPAANITIYPIFEEITYSVTVDHNITGGSITTDVKSVVNGGLIPYVTTADEGYKIVGVQMYETGTQPSEDFEAVGTDFTMPGYDVTITAKFETLSYDIEVRKSDDSIDGNTVTTSPELSANYGETVRVVLPLDSIGILKSVKVIEVINGVEGSAIELSATDYSFTMPANPVVVEYEYEADGYKIEISDTVNGEVKTDPVSVAKENEKVIITATPEDGYSIGTITVLTKQEETVVETTVSDLGANMYSFDMPAEDVVVKVTFIENEYNIRVDYSDVEGGYIEVFSTTDYNTPITTAKSGTNLVIKWHTYDGFHLQSMLVSTDNLPSLMSASVSNTVTSSYTMTASDITLKPVWIAKDTYVSIDNTPGGKITIPSSYNTPGNTVSLTVIPDTGYALVEGSVQIVNGDVIAYNDISKTYDFTMPGASVTVTASFEAVDYDITVETDSEDYVTVNSTANYNERVVVTVSVPEGKALESLVYTYDGKEVTISGYTFTMPAASVEIKATFVDASYRVVKADPSNGSFTVVDEFDNEVSTIAFGQVVTILPVANSGYSVERVFYADQITAGVTTINPNEDGEYTYTASASDVVIYVSFKVAEKLTVTIDDAQDYTNGTVSLSSLNVATGDSVTVYANANTGYKVGSITATDSEGDITVTDNKLTVRSGDVKVLVTFVMETYNITGDDVTITDNISEASYGDEITFTVNDKDGYSLANVYVISQNRYIEFSVSEGTYTFTMPANDVEIDVAYNASLVEGSTDVTGSGFAVLTSKTHSVGDTVSLQTVSFGFGWVLESITVMVDGEATEDTFDLSSNFHTFTAPAKDFIVYAVFSQDKYTLSLDSEVINGTVLFDSSESIVAAQGDKVTVSVKPDSGYQYNYYTVNRAEDFSYEGAYAGDESEFTFTFTMPGSNTVMYVDFSQIVNYSIATPSVATYGLISIDVEEATVNSEVVISVQPRIGYAIDTAAYIELDSGTRTDIDFNEENIAVITMPESDIELDVTFMSVNSMDTDNGTADLDDEILSTDTAQTDTDTEITDTELELDNSEDDSSKTELNSTPTTSTSTTEGTIVTTGVLTGDTTGVAGLGLAIGLAGIFGFLSRRKK